MMEFACKKIRREDLLRCSFGLNKTEYDLLLFLLQRDSELTAAGIAQGTGLERTTVQKALKNLLLRKLVRRMQRNLPKGGYTYSYRVERKPEIKAKTKEIISEWYKDVVKEVDRW
jgi:predicted transcriptional regulator